MVRGSGYLFVYLTLKYKEAKNAIHISLFLKAVDISSPNYSHYYYCSHYFHIFSQTFIFKIFIKKERKKSVTYSIIIIVRIIFTFFSQTFIFKMFIKKERKKRVTYRFRYFGRMDIRKIPLGCSSYLTVIDSLSV